MINCFVCLKAGLLSLLIIQTGFTDVNLSDILRQWERREGGFKALSVIWDETVVNAASGAEVSKLQRSLILEGERIKATRTGKVLGLSGKLVDDSTTVAWNGKFRTDQTIGGERPLAVFNDGAKSVVANNQMRPILLFVFGTKPKYGGVDLTNYRLVSQNEQIDGFKCVRIQAVRQYADSWEGQKTDFWLDASPGVEDFRVRRFTTHANGKKRYDVRIEYGKLGSCDCPISWEGTVSNVMSGTVEKSFSAKLSKFELLDTVADSDFDVPIAEGAIVGDYRGIANVNQLPTVYLQAKDGNRRFFTESEQLNANDFNDLVLPHVDANKTSWPRMAIGLFVLMGFGLFVLFKMGGKR